MPRKSRWYWMAASITLLIALGGFWLTNRPSETERLFNQYFTPDPGLPTVMGEARNFQFLDAMVNYKSGQYKQAIEKWEVLLPQKPKNDTLNYFLGVTYLANNDTQKAVKFLEETLEEKNSEFVDEANFYLGLAHLKLKNTTEAEVYLSKSQHKKVEEILEKLKNSTLK